MHSNESACRKSGRLGLEQVTSGTPYPDDDLLGGGITPVAACIVEMISTMILEEKVSGA